MGCHASRAKPPFYAPVVLPPPGPAGLAAPGGETVVLMHAAPSLVNVQVPLMQPMAMSSRVVLARDGNVPGVERPADDLVARQLKGRPVPVAQTELVRRIVFETAA